MDQQQHQWILALEGEWSEPHGFLYTIRQGTFSAAQAESLLKTLGDIKAGDKQVLERRLVSLVWYLPIFMSWQKVRVLEAGGDGTAYDRLTNQVLGLIQEILGVP
ncbi:MAG TPA: hypothetical protein VKU80_07335 [Planctomycetota bacterium]|nr:hypothetical protein [Planctomycetota bacterium]